MSWLPSACMRSEGTVVILSVCLSVLKLACSKFIRSTNGTDYLTRKKRDNILWDFL